MTVEVIIKMNKEYRSLDIKSLNNEENKMLVEGYAVVFEQTTILYSYDGIDYKEVID